MAKWLPGRLRMMYHVENGAANRKKGEAVATLVQGTAVHRDGENERKAIKCQFHSMERKWKVQSVRLEKTKQKIPPNIKI